MPVAESGSLQGLKVLVPRPHPYGEQLAQQIESRGGKSILFPVIEISDPEDFEPLDQCLSELESISLVILVSLNAAASFIKRIRHFNLVLPEHVQFAVLGTKSSEYCKSQGLEVHYVPTENQDSEGLLACLESVNLDGKRVAILRGQSGRDRIRSELTKRGANVNYVECYNRSVTTQPFAEVVDTWSQQGINAVVLSSISIVDALVELLGPANLKLLTETAAITISERITGHCIQLGMNTVLTCERPDEASILQKLEELLTSGGV